MEGKAGTPHIPPLVVVVDMERLGMVLPQRLRQGMEEEEHITKKAATALL